VKINLKNPKSAIWALKFESIGNFVKIKKIWNLKNQKCEIELREYKSTIWAPKMVALNLEDFL
jgi:hypothetical protein